MNLMNWGLKTRSRKSITCLLALFVFLSMLLISHPGLAYAKTEESDPADHFEVWLVDPANKDNKIELLNYTIPELEQMPQVERAYSSIDSLPAPVFTAARGIDLIDFLESLKLDMGSISSFKFRTTDFDTDGYPPNFGKVLQASVLLDSERYYFPQIQECWDEYWDEDLENPSNSAVFGYWKDGSDPFTRKGKILLRPMLGIVSFQARAIGSDPGKPVYLEPRFDLMDGETTLRLCYGQKNPGECITMDYLKWTYKMEVTGRLLPIALNPDTSANRVGTPIDITFAENIAWQNGIAAVSIGDTPLGKGQYTLTPGKITIAPTVFSAAGTYTVKVTSGFNESSVEQEVLEASASDPHIPPTLIADSSQNIIGNSMTITFSDDESWRKAISEIKVDGNAVKSSNYSTTEAGKITIDGSIFSAAGSYSIVIKATGYQDAGLQQIVFPLPGPVTLKSIEISKTAAKLLYSVDEPLDISGLEVTGHYSDGSSKVENITMVNISGFDSSKPASRQTLTITVGNKTITYTVSIFQAKTAADNSNISVTPDIPLKITMPEGIINSSMKVAQNMPLPPVIIESSQAILSIPEATLITGSDIINLPQVKPGSTVKAPGIKTIGLVIEVGSDSNIINFSKPVRLLLKGQASKSAGFIDQAGNLRKISKPASLKALTGDDAAETVAALFEREKMQDAAVDFGKDLVIWTKHLTKFIAYIPLTDTPVIPPKKIADEFIIIPFEQIARTQTIGIRGGIVKTAGAVLNFPTNSLESDIKVTIKKITQDIPAISSGFKLLGEVYEITSDKDNKFRKPVTITLLFDPSEVEQEKHDVGIYCWCNQQWTSLEQVKADMASGKVSGEVGHFSKFAILLSKKSQKPIILEKKAPEVPLPKPILSDIAGHWAQANIIKLVNAGVISGYPDATFQADKGITRAEFVTAVVKAFKLESRSGQVFNDTTQHWAKESISTAAAYGMTSGYDAGSFCPDDAITREQMAVMISKAAKLPAGEGKTFIDSAQIEDWAQAAVAAASSKNIISGYPDNSFRPKANANRAEAVSVIVNALNNLPPAGEGRMAE
ncbi:hemoblobin-interacting domain-containing protein [Syntrophomonas wolfei]|jgi:hypothetical protein|uniref:hemoblobin-interacting domain-containing protein n=1 Tax=Syntrophomonas wolfei TaxID=863 RepID=UPI0007748A53|nr:S-layer homology domain-containing protein [Syntrophomonas wolfei]